MEAAVGSCVGECGLVADNWRISRLGGAGGVGLEADCERARKREPWPPIGGRGGARPRAVAEALRDKLGGTIARFDAEALRDKLGGNIARFDAEAFRDKIGGGMLLPLRFSMRAEPGSDGLSVMLCSRL